MIFFLLLLVVSIDAYKVCFPQIECFNIDSPSVLKPLPKSPEELDVKIFFCNRFVERAELPNNNSIPQMIFEKNLNGHHFTFIAHGFMSTSNEIWVRKMEEALIKHHKTNVFTIDWSRGNRPPNYFQAVSNLKTVAGVIIRFLSEQIARNLTSSDSVHMIGQSLGAHLVSFVSKKLQVDYLTGLDPAEPGFGNRANRIDVEDARYVEIIHTSAAKRWLSLGHNEPLGDVDFYINGGLKQPACVQKIFSYFTSKFHQIIDSFTCDHMKSQEYFTESLKSACFLGIKWDLNLTNIPDKNSMCSNEYCQVMGPNGRHMKGRGIFYVHTKKSPPYCDHDDIDDGEKYKENML